MLTKPMSIRGQVSLRYIVVHLLGVAVFGDRVGGFEVPAYEMSAFSNKDEYFIHR